jgi:hypothetical protein
LKKMKFIETYLKLFHYYYYYYCLLIIILIINDCCQCFDISTTQINVKSVQFNDFKCGRNNFVLNGFASTLWTKNCLNNYHVYISKDDGDSFSIIKDYNESTQTFRLNSNLKESGIRFNILAINPNDKQNVIFQI